MWHILFGTLLQSSRCVKVTQTFINIFSQMGLITTHSFKDLAYTVFAKSKLKSGIPFLICISSKFEVDQILAENSQKKKRSKIKASQPCRLYQGEVKREKSNAEPPTPKDQDQWRTFTNCYIKYNIFNGRQLSVSEYIQVHDLRKSMYKVVCKSKNQPRTESNARWIANKKKTHANLNFFEASVAYTVSRLAHVHILVRNALKPKWKVYFILKKKKKKVVEGKKKNHNKWNILSLFFLITCYAQKSPAACNWLWLFFSSFL